MGNNQSSVGDLFYRDNPNRRRRADELSNNIAFLRTEFETLMVSR